LFVRHPQSPFVGRGLEISLSSMLQNAHTPFTALDGVGLPRAGDLILAMSVLVSDRLRLSERYCHFG
jgi:hypothetical protein